MTTTAPAPLPTLDVTLSSLVDPPTLPRPLPVAHLSAVRSFEEIVTAGRLAPRTCRFFGTDLLYLFYGGVFYRPQNHVTKNATELPVAFVFGPKVLSHVLRHYPFDTGAVMSGRVGPWTASLAPVFDFSVRGGDIHAPGRMVHHLFGSNKKYLEGEANPNCTGQPHPLPTLHAYMTADLTSQNVDHRQSVIECQLGDALPLDSELIWVGFPASYMGTFAKWCDTTHDVPAYFIYPDKIIFNPYALAQMLETMAYESVFKRYVGLPS